MERIAEPIIYNLDYTEKMDNQYEIVEPNDERLSFLRFILFIIKKIQNILFMLEKLQILRNELFNI